MQIFHTSPSEITEINSIGRFGSFLFFADSEYVMTAGDHFAYTIEVDGGEIIEASRLFYAENASDADAIVAEVMNQFKVDEDTACDLIDETMSVLDLQTIEDEDIAEASWDMQFYTARAAIALGYRGVQVNDEQGAAYMIDMLGRESELNNAE